MMITNRRLAVIDTFFPWQLSGFRYWENIQIHAQRPDTLFFATEPHSDKFPKIVYPFSQFKKLADSEGITDVYCVFLNLVLSLLGAYTLPDGTQVPGSNPYINIRDFLMERKIKLHTTLYPGGGLAQGTRPEFFDIVTANCSTIFTNVEEVLLNIKTSIYQPVVINTELYNLAARCWSPPFHLIFCAFNYPRKGFPLLVKAYNSLNSDDFHLHIVGNWEDQLSQLKNKRYTFHGALQPEKLALLYQHCHVFINCSRPDHLALDGFPTTTAADAMATGCLLLTTNPRNDQLILKEGMDYLKIDAEAQSILHSLNWISNHTRKAKRIAANGAKTVRSSFNMKKIVNKKLTHLLGNT
ncbi:glycosyltransferase [Paenibacillus fonticola]|uniref:glycosyltransferase n=1 Tax=Paenibacillus fonticola TaxID=379896 RepID=UPI00037C41A3|nr:glycosyltransferase [Paenibacillus fonticola]